ncbi:uncharacterized protein [Palaemon carinicauda]|uniref:uncharacterized protein n=1 Tax=Palaemon carinicauda TaxID=392227 RepID=UPI0035B6A8C0
MKRVQGGWVVGEGNDGGERVIDFAVAFNLPMINTFFEKMINRLITYSSGGMESQIDLLLSKRDHLTEVRNCKVINGENVAAQHGLVVIVCILRNCRSKKTRMDPKIKQWKLKEAELRVLFKESAGSIRLNKENLRTEFEIGLPNEAVNIGVTRKEVEQAVKKMKNSKASGLDNIPAEIWKSLGEEGIDIGWELMQKIFNQEKILEEWRGSLIIPIYKGNGDTQKCGNYRGIKIISHTMKIWEKIIE